MANGQIKEKAYLFNPGDCLRDESDRPEYASFLIDEINAGEQSVRRTAHRPSSPNSNSWVRSG